MPHYRAQVTLKTADAVPENFATNTLYFEADTLADLTTVNTAVENFYKTLGTNFSTLCTQNAHQIKYYDMQDPEPRAPVMQTSFNLTANPSAPPLPPEVAMCISYQGAQVSGTPQSRRRGRIYVPFFKTTSIAADGRPASGTVTDLKNAAQSLLTASDTAPTWTWVQYSKVNDGFADVDSGWVDNEWDTQRRRGRAYTSRTTFT